MQAVTLNKVERLPPAACTLRLWLVAVVVPQVHNKAVASPDLCISPPALASTGNAVAVHPVITIMSARSLLSKPRTARKHAALGCQHGLVGLCQQLGFSCQ